MGGDRRSEPATRCVWSLRVVVDPLGFVDLPCFGEIAEVVFVQTFVPEPAVASLDKGVLHGFHQCEVVPGKTGVLTLSQHGMRRHFRSIVGDSHFWLVASAGQVIQITSHPCA